MADTLLILPLNGNQKNTNKSTYQQEIVSEINGTEEISQVNFPINLKWIQQHQWAEPSLMAKCKYFKYHKGYFDGGSNENITLITCKQKKVIPSKLLSYDLHWYHTCIFHPVMYRTEAIIRQHLYWHDIIYAACKEVTNCDT